MNNKNIPRGSNSNQLDACDINEKLGKYPTQFAISSLSMTSGSSMTENSVQRKDTVDKIRIRYRIDNTEIDFDDVVPTV